MLGSEARMTNSQLWDHEVNKTCVWRFSELCRDVWKRPGICFGLELFVMVTMICFTVIGALEGSNKVTIGFAPFSCPIDQSLVIALVALPLITQGSPRLNSSVQQ